MRGRRRIIELTPKQTGMTRYAWRSIGYEPGGQVAAMSQTLADTEIADQLGSGSIVN